MPLPKPSKGQKENDFIEKCMSQLETEFPDNDQRLAVCYTQWKKRSNDMKETRIFPATDISIETREDGTKKIVMYPAVFNKLSHDLGGFREKISPGAFKATIKTADVKAKFNHDSNYVLGRSKNKTLTMKEDDRGLYTEVDPPDTQWARDLQIQIERGDIDQGSFAFRTIDDSWEVKNEENIRTLNEVELLDVSVVTDPAYPDTAVALRALEEFKKPDTVAPDTPTKDDEPTPMHRIRHLKRRLELKTKISNRECEND